MSCTIFYKGTLKDSATPEAVFECVGEMAKQIDCEPQREAMAMVLAFNQGTSEPLVLAFQGGKIDGFCKWNGEDEQEFYRILDLFIKIKPLFKSLKVEDDGGIWHSYFVRNRSCKIQLRSLRSPQERQLLQRMLQSLEVPPNDLESFIRNQLLLRPFHPSLLRIILQDLIKIMQYQTPDDFDPKAIIERARVAGSPEYDYGRMDIRSFKFDLPCMILQIWFGHFFLYQNKNLVCQTPATARGLNTSKNAALFGTLSIFLHCFSGGAVNGKHAEMIKLAAKYYGCEPYGEAMVVDEPEKELESFVSMMDYLGLSYVGVGCE